MTDNKREITRMQSTSAAEVVEDIETYKYTDIETEVVSHLENCSPASIVEIYEKIMDKTADKEFKVDWDK